MSIPNPPAGAPAPQLPPPMPPYGAQVPEQKNKKNVVAMIAMIVAIVGFIFACIPGALILGWVLLPIAFILSIVSLFLKGDRKWMGIVGLIVAVVGTIVGFVVFFAVVATSFNDAFGSGDTTVTQSQEQKSDAKAADEEKPADAAEQGTRENPYPLASKISSDDWTVVINSVNADGDAVVAQANQFNDKAPAGSHYEIVNYTVTYTGDDKGMAAEVQLAMVTGAGNVINSFDSLVALNDALGIDEMYKSASATGSVAFAVPDGDKPVLRVTPGLLADEVFVKP